MIKGRVLIDAFNHFHEFPLISVSTTLISLNHNNNKTPSPQQKPPFISSSQGSLNGLQLPDTLLRIDETFVYAIKVVVFVVSKTSVAAIIFLDRC